MRTRKSKAGSVASTSCKAVALAVAIAACLPSISAAAEPVASKDVVVNFNIPAGKLSAALEQFSAQSGVQLMYQERLVDRKSSAGVNGAFSISEALTTILKGAGITAQKVNSTTYALKATPGADENREDAKNRSTPIKRVPKVARQGSSTESATDFDAIQVVGTRLGVTSPLESALPTKVITREEIDRLGVSTVAQVMSYFSEVSVNHTGQVNPGGDNINATSIQLRGLSNGATLVLINGRRVATSAFSASGLFDLSSIPLAMVERVELLPAGASAIYGGDGLAGVVNIVLRRGASGLEATWRRDLGDSYGESMASVVWGRSWDQAHVTVAANWRKSGRLSSSARELTADRDFRRFGGEDYRWPLSNLANIYSTGGCDPSPENCWNPVEERDNLPGLTSPFATVPAGQDGTALTPEDFASGAGRLNYDASGENVRSPSDTYGVLVDGSVNLSHDMELFFEVHYTDRSVPASEIELSVYDMFVPSGNPFNPFGVDVRASYIYPDTGMFREFKQQTLRTGVGLRGKLKSADWEVFAWRTRDKSKLGDSYFDYAAIKNALEATDPAKALNVFVGDGSAPVSKEVLRSLLAETAHNNYGSELRAVNGYLRGSPFNLPAGGVQALAGFEYQHEAIDWNEGTSQFVDPIAGSDISQAIFFEARAPLLSRDVADATQQIATLTAAFRRESNNRYKEEDASTSVVGIEVRPQPNLLFRATHSTAFKPIGILQANREVYHWRDLVFDPQRNGEQASPEATWGGGIAPGLRPETSTSKTAGITYLPTSLWQLSLTYWDIEVLDGFQYTNAQFVVDNEKYFPGRVTRDPVTGVITAVDIRNINIGRAASSGFDISIKSHFATDYGHFFPALDATYTQKYVTVVASGADATNNLGVRRDSGWAPRWKIVPRMSWELDGRYSASITGRYVSAYLDPVPLYTGPSAGELQTLGSLWFVDLTAGYDLSRSRFLQSYGLETAKVSLIANNLFNRLPEFCNSCGDWGYDMMQNDIIGRYVGVELKVGL